MSSTRAVLPIWILAVGWSCRSEPPRPERAVPHPGDPVARSNHLEPEGPVLGFVTSPRTVDGRATERSVPEAPAEDDGSGPAAVRTVAGPLEGDGVHLRASIEAGRSLEESGSEPLEMRGESAPDVDEARDAGRGSRRYVLSGKDDGPVHLEIFDRPPDEPRLQLDLSLPRRFQDYSEPPEAIRNRLRRIHCVPCPRR